MSRRDATDGALLTLGVLLLHLALVLPSHPAGLDAARILRPTWDLPVILLALAFWPNRGPRALIVALAGALLVLRLADLGTYLAFSRPFNPLLDLHLLVSGWALLSASVGGVAALAAVMSSLVAIGIFASLLWAGLSVLPRLSARSRAAACIVAAGAPVAALAVPGWSAHAAAPVVAAQVERMGRGVADLSAFTASLDDVPAAAPGFGALTGRDVIIAFVESYGRSFLDDPDFARISRPRLNAVGKRLRDAGWHVRSAHAAAPTRGGQSWLSHATLLSGLLVDSQTRYDRLIISDRPSLNRLFGGAGWRTGAVMPAITMDWPEAGWHGYDIMLDADGLGYRGQPFEWVTMPDQYSWAAMDRMLRGPGPDMVELALITSHAPWTPLPRIVDWGAVGDGSIFDGTMRDGDSPRAVWSDTARIREHYARSLDYTLEIMGQYIALKGDGAVFVVLGDHQPAPLLTGPDAPPDVPVHIVADDPGLLELLPGDVFADGLVPAPDGRVIPLQHLHDLITEIFETPELAERQEN